MAAWPRRQYTGPFFGGRHGHQGLPRTHPQATAHPAAATARPQSARPLAVSNADRLALITITASVAVGILAVLLHDILRAVRRR